MTKSMHNKLWWKLLLPCQMIGNVFSSKFCEPHNMPYPQENQNNLGGDDREDEKFIMVKARQPLSDFMVAHFISFHLSRTRWSGTNMYQLTWEPTSRTSRWIGTDWFKALMRRFSNLIPLYNGNRQMHRSEPKHMHCICIAMCQI